MTRHEVELAAAVVVAAAVGLLLPGVRAQIVSVTLLAMSLPLMISALLNDTIGGLK